MIRWPADRVGLMWTPLVFAAVFSLGVWADPIDLFGLPSAGLTRVAFAVAAVTSVGVAAHLDEGSRLVAMLAGTAATLSRGLTIIVIGQDAVPRKSELIGGSVWLAVGWLVFAMWVVTVPSMWRWRRRRERV